MKKISNYIENKDFKMNPVEGKAVRKRHLSSLDWVGAELGHCDEPQTCCCCYAHLYACAQVCESIRWPHRSDIWPGARHRWGFDILFCIRARLCVLLVVVKQLESCLPASPLVISCHIWRPLTPSTFKAAPNSHPGRVAHTFHNKKKEVTNIFGDWDDPVLYI